MSEEFGGALPSDIVGELNRLPVGFLQQVIEYRAYAAAKAVNQISPKGWDESAMRTLAMEIEMALAQEAIDRG